MNYIIMFLKCVNNFILFLLLISLCNCSKVIGQDKEVLIKVDNIEFLHPEVIHDSIKSFVIQRFPRGKEFFDSDSISTTSFYYCGEQPEDSLSIYLDNKLINFKQQVLYSPITSACTKLFSTNRIKEKELNVKKIRIIFHKSKRVLETKIELNNPFVCISTYFNSQVEDLQEGYGVNNTFVTEVINLPDKVKIHYRKIKSLTSGLY